LRLAFEAGKTIAVGGEGSGQKLDRDIPLQSRVSRPVDVTHPTRPEQADDLIGSQASARQEHQRSGL
jgi:hypothetical protein